MELKDWRGQPLNLGDIVIYRGKKGVVEGKIDSFVVQRTWKGDQATQVKVIPSRRSDGYPGRAGKVSISAKHITKLGSTPIEFRGKSF